VDEVNVLDVTTGRIRDRLEVYNLNQMAIDQLTGSLVVNTGGDAKVWAGGNAWLAELRGIGLAADQDFQLDSARRRVTPGLRADRWWHWTWIRCLSEAWSNSRWRDAGRLQS